MTFKPEGPGSQLEMLRILRQELTLKEKELADQKWVFERFLESPTWRFTQPIRWTINQIRKAVGNGKKLSNTSIATESETELDLGEIQISALGDGNRSKKIFATHYRVQLESFLASGSSLELPNSATPSISVIIVLFNRAELTFACLRSIAQCLKADTEVIIVDNASTDETPRLLDRIRGAHIIRNARNLNFLLAVNQAAREARGDFLLLLNSDAQLLPGTVSCAHRTLTSSSNIGAVGGKIILLDGLLQEAGSIIWQDGSCYGYGRGDDPMGPAYMFRRDVDYCSGAFLLTPRVIWEQLKGFDEAFKPAYYEEADYCMRLRAKGLRVVYEPDAAILHYEFASSGSLDRAIRLQIDHQKIFARRHEDALKSQCPPGDQMILAARSKSRGDRILFLDDRTPHTWLGSGFPRARTLILSMIKQGCFVTVFPLSEFREDWDVVYSDLPREIEVITGLGSKMLEGFLRERKNYYNSIVASRPHNMKKLQSIMKAHPEWFTNTHIIYDAEALFTRRDALFRKLGGNPWTEQEEKKALTEEIALAASANCVVSVSEEEGAAFRQCGIRNIQVIGHTISADPQPAAFDKRSGLLFVGAIHSEASPNGDSMIWFLTEVYPKIKGRLGESVCLTIAGLNNSARIRSLAGSDVHITGHLQDLSSLYAASKLFVAPTRFAAGLPHKIHEAAARGLPVVATALLASQLNWTNSELAICENADDFASRCVELYTNAEKWLNMRNAALDRVKKDCSNENFDKTVGALLDAARRS